MQDRVPACRLLLSDHPVSFQDVKSMSIGAFNSKRAPWNSWQEPKMAASAFEYLMICQVVESHRTVRGAAVVVLEREQVA